MLVKLRVQNPNDTPVEYNGIALQMDVQGKRFASGVSDATGSVPRFGEAVISVPVTISAMGIARQAIGVMQGGTRDRIAYEMKGKLSGSLWRAGRFSTRGELTLPASLRLPGGQGGDAQ